MIKHTEYTFPWTLEREPEEHGNCYQLLDGDGDSIAAFDVDEDGPAALQAGRICAAAPDMRDALKAILAEMDNGVSMPETRAKAEAALAKAEPSP